MDRYGNTFLDLDLLFQVAQPILVPLVLLDAQTLFRLLNAILVLKFSCGLMDFLVRLRHNLVQTWLIVQRLKLSLKE